MKRWVDVHPQAVADLTVALAAGLIALAGHLTSLVLYRFADWCDQRLAARTDLGGDD